MTPLTAPFWIRCDEPRIDIRIEIGQVPDDIWVYGMSSFRRPRGQHLFSLWGAIEDGLPSRLYLTRKLQIMVLSGHETGGGPLRRSVHWVRDLDHYYKPYRDDPGQPAFTIEVIEGAPRLQIGQQTWPITPYQPEQPWSELMKYRRPANPLLLRSYLKDQLDR